MNQAELIAAVADRTGVAKTNVEAVLKSTADQVYETLSLGDEVALPGLGKLKTKQTAARIGRNPKTGDELKIPAKTKPVFVAAKALKDAV